jgi:glycine cleavage system H protein
MTVLLVLATFAIFLMVDWLLTRRHALPAALPEAQTTPAALLLEPTWVAGFQVPEALYYHRGHTWALPEDDGNVRVGLDDFARRLLGHARTLHLPDVGSTLIQGAPSASVCADGREAELVAPVAGEVSMLNPDLVTQPHLATDDPYGRGWLFKVRAHNLPANLRNLMTGSLARRFAEDAREALDLRLMALSGSVLHDGGEPLADFASHLPAAEWRRLVSAFLLT